MRMAVFWNGSVFQTLKKGKEASPAQAVPAAATSLALLRWCPSTWSLWCRGDNQEGIMGWSWSVWKLKSCSHPRSAEGYLAGSTWTPTPSLPKAETFPVPDPPGRCRKRETGSCGALCFPSPFLVKLLAPVEVFLLCPVVWQDQEEPWGFVSREGLRSAGVSRCALHGVLLNTHSAPPAFSPREKSNGKVPAPSIPTAGDFLFSSFPRCDVINPTFCFFK